MKSMARMVLVAGLILMMGAAAPADTAATLAKIHADAAGSLAVLRCKYKTELVEHTLGGQAFCIGADREGKAVFMTLSLDARMQEEELSDFSLLLPGADRKEVKAQLMGIDPETNLGFVRVLENGSFAKIAFDTKAQVKPGQQVFSIGLIPGDAANTPYLGTAYVSAVRRLPRKLVSVTGGALTQSGSPVFNAEGKAIGLVGRQLFQGYQMVANRQTMTVGLQPQQDTSYFLPIEEFAHVLRMIPTPGKQRKLPWLGVIHFEGVNEELADALQLDRPGVMIDKLVPGFAAEKAGLKNRDVVVAVNGQPLERLATPQLTAQEMMTTLLRFAPGEKITLRVLRSGQTKDYPISLDAMPKAAHEAKRYADKQLGMVVREKVMLDKYTDVLGTADVDGLVVVAVARNSPAAKGDLRADDVITNVNALAVTTVDAFQAAVEPALKAQPPKAINLMVRRGNQNVAVAIQPTPAD